MIDDVLLFIDGLESNLVKLSSSQDKADSNVSDNKESIGADLTHNVVTKHTPTSQATLHDECMNTIVQLDVNNDMHFKPMMNIIDKEKITSKKTTNNRFTLAKKKYSKPIIQETKYTLGDLLTHEN